MKKQARMLIRRIRFNYIVKKISKETKRSIEYEKKRILRIKRKYKVLPQDYYDKKYYLLSEYKILDLITDISDDEGEKLIAERIAKEKCVTVDEAKSLIKHLKQKYSFNNYEIMRRQYYKFSDEKIEQIKAFTKQREKKNYVLMACKSNSGKDKEGFQYDEMKNRFDHIGEKFNLTSSRIYYGKFYELSDEKIRKKLRKQDRDKLKKVISCAKECGMTTQQFLKKKKRIQLINGDSEGNFYKLKHYMRKEADTETFISQGDTSYLIHKYNLSDDINILSNKTEFSSFFKNEFGRACWSNTENSGFEAFSDFAEKAGTIIMKPIAELQGRGIRKINTDEYEKKELYNELIDGPDVICEEYIFQHPEMASLGGGSVNTVRVVTIMSEEKCNFIYAILKIGGKAIADNLARGGLAAEIDLETGTIISEAFDKNGNCFLYDPYSERQLKGFTVPFWNKVLELVEGAAEKIPNVKYIGWDVAITERGPILVEGNADAYLAFIEIPNQKNKTGCRHRIMKYLV